MIACSLAIFWVPIACTIVTIEPRASGIAATASATANIIASRSGISRYIDRPNTSAQTARIRYDSFFPKSSNAICSGVFFSFALFKSPAILPISVFIAVSVTKTSALP